jgi:malate synthase
MLLSANISGRGDNRRKKPSSDKENRMLASATESGIEIRATVNDACHEVLTPEALDFVVELERVFGPQRRSFMEERIRRQESLDSGKAPDFLPETQWIREAAWSVARIPKDLQDRRVEITGPVERKVVINALNSGANGFMADFEDSCTPTWRNLIEGQINLRDAVDGSIGFTDPTTSKTYTLAESPAVLHVRPRGWHLTEEHLFIDGHPMSAALFDFGIFLFHNAKKLIAKGTGPYFYLPKLENHHEARLWNQVFLHSQARLALPSGVIKATVLIETVLAAFEMDEILYELREHCVGLNCGRWDYIFSFIKKFRNDPRAVMPDRSEVTMTTHFLRSYSSLLVKTCHRRLAHAMGGMSAYIPVKQDALANEAALAQVRADKEREAGDGYDGTWVAHPALVPIAKNVFDRRMPAPNQIEQKRNDVNVTALDLLTLPRGRKTEAGLRQSIAVSIGYLDSWLNGIGCVPLFNLMEDAATAEICRAQVWQWMHHGAHLPDNRPIDRTLVRSILREELETRRLSGSTGHSLDEAASLFCRLVESETFEEFLTIPAYRLLLEEFHG